MHYRRVAARVIGEEARPVKVHAAIRRHAAILRLERHIAAGMDARTLVVDSIPEQQGRHGDFAFGEGAPARRTQTMNRYGIHRLLLGE